MKDCTLRRMLGSVAGTLALTLGAGSGVSAGADAATTTAPRSAATASVAAMKPHAPFRFVLNQSRAGWVSSLEPPGRHHVKKFDPPYSFSLAKATSAAAFLPWVTTLTLAGTKDHPKLVVAFWNRSLDLLDPAVEPPSHSIAKAARNVPRTARGVLDWLTANPRLIVTGLRGVTVGGLRGTEIEVAAKTAGTFANEACPATCVPFLITPPLGLSRNGGDWFEESADVGARVRIEILAVHGKLVLIVIDSTGRNRAQNMRIADRFLSTVTFD